MKKGERVGEFVLLFLLKVCRLQVEPDLLVAGGDGQDVEAVRLPGDQERGLAGAGTTSLCPPEESLPAGGGGDHLQDEPPPQHPQADAHGAVRLQSPDCGVRPGN